MLHRLLSFSPFISAHLCLRSPRLLRDLQLQSLVRPNTHFFPVRPFPLFRPPVVFQRPFFLDPQTSLLHFPKLMQHKALQHHAQGGASMVDGALEEKVPVLDGTGEDSGSSSSSMAVEVFGNKGVNFGADGIGVVGSGAAAGINSVGDASSESGNISSGRASRIREKLERGLSPVELEVEDISYQHAGHVAVRGNSNGETHFNVRIASKEFEGKSLVKRHRLVYDLLQDELQSGLHALSIVAKTPSDVGTIIGAQK